MLVFHSFDPGILLGEHLRNVLGFNLEQCWTLRIALKLNA